MSDTKGHLGRTRGIYYGRLCKYIDLMSLVLSGSLERIIRPEFNKLLITTILCCCTFVNSSRVNLKNGSTVFTEVDTDNAGTKISENFTLVNDLRDSVFVNINDRTKQNKHVPTKSAKLNSTIDNVENKEILTVTKVQRDKNVSTEADYINKLINSLNNISRHVNKSISESHTKTNTPVIDIFQLINNSHNRNVSIKDFIDMTAVSPLAALVESTRTQVKKTTSVPSYKSTTADWISQNNKSTTLNAPVKDSLQNKTEYQDNYREKMSNSSKIQIKQFHAHNTTNSRDSQDNNFTTSNNHKPNIVRKDNATTLNYEINDLQKDTINLWNSFGQNLQKSNVTTHNDRVEVSTENNPAYTEKNKEDVTEKIHLKNLFHFEDEFEPRPEPLEDKEIIAKQNSLTPKPAIVSHNKMPTEHIVKGNITELFLTLLKTMRKENQSITDTELLNNISNIAIKKIPESKNISAIIVTYCESKNKSSKDNTKNMSDKKHSTPTDNFDDDSFDIDDIINKSPLLLDVEYEEISSVGDLTNSERKELMEAADYGIERMRDLYGVQEPKLYSMGYWLDHNNPARYVAAFNAPMEEASEYAKYGYASLQAATKLKELLKTQENAESREEVSQFHAPALKDSALHDSCPLRGVPKCPPASKRYRTHDGSCNNPVRPRWGSAMTPVQRFLSPIYSDGLQSARRATDGSKLPSAREISVAIHEDHDVETLGITHLLMQWGQFIDHDITASSQSRGFNGSVPQCCDGDGGFVQGEFMHPECMAISVPADDPFYGQFGVRCLEFVRSSPAPREHCALGWREQINQVTSYLDASPVYGNSAKQSDKLRLFRNGMLQYGRVQHRRPLLPPGADELCRLGAAAADCFRAGDGRANEHPGLVSAHIVWLRRHNRIATELAHLNPHWSDEKIYQEARKIVGAMIQHITYREFLPIVLGSEVMRVFDLTPLPRGYYEGYSVDTNAGVANSFGAAAFRFGHSLVQASFVRYDTHHNPIRNNVSLHDELSNPSNIWSSGAVDRLLLGMVNQPIRKRDEFITEELTNHLFQTPSFPFGMDLAAINVQRGRDHGIPPYTMWREPCGLTPIRRWEDLHRVMPSRVVKKLQDLYRHVDDVDLFTGGVSERPVVGGLVGPTFACVIAQQAANTRKGDRFWYENGQFESSFTPAQLQQVRKVTLAQILCQTLDSIETIQPFVFMAADEQKNKRIPCESSFINSFDLTPWIEVGSNFDNNIPDFDKSDQSKDAPNRPVTKKPFHNNDFTNFTKFKQRTTTKRPKTSTLRITSTTSKNTVKSTISTRLTSQIDDKIDLPKNSFPTPNPLNVTATLNTSTDKLTNALDDKLDFRNKTRRFEDDASNKEQLRHGIHEYMTSQANKRPVRKPIESNRSNQQNWKGHRKRPQTIVQSPIGVTENVNKFTYLINIVPKTTPAYQTSNKNVVKITYQTEDKYKRPQPIFINNKHTIPVFHNNKIVQRPTELDDSYYLRTQSEKKTNTTAIPLLAARSSVNTSSDNSSFPEAEPLTQDLTESTTVNSIYKLVTFSHVGTFTRDTTTQKTPTIQFDDRPNKYHYTTKRADIINAFVNNSPALKLMTENKTDFIYNSAPMKQTTKRFTPHRDIPLTNDSFKLTTDKEAIALTQTLKRRLTKTDLQITTPRLDITTYHYTNKRRTTTYKTEATTQTTDRVTDSLDDNNEESMTTNPPRYYYLGNVLHKYVDDKNDQTKRHGLRPDKSEKTLQTKTDLEQKDADDKDEQTEPLKPDVQKTETEQIAPSRKSNDELNAKNTPKVDPNPRQDRPHRPLKTSMESTRRVTKPARTKAQATKDSKPKVTFDVIPSENSPHLWATYDEKTDIDDTSGTHAMPPVRSDPFALNELPRPMNLTQTASHKPRRKKPSRP